MEKVEVDCSKKGKRCDDRNSALCRKCWWNRNKPKKQTYYRPTSKRRWPNIFHEV